MSLFSTYFGTISVKDPTFGAVGDGTTDDTAAIQAAINAAFGSVSSPHGHSNPYINRVLFFPPGQYLITSPLYLAGVLGGVLRGAGNGTTLLKWRPTNGATIPGGGTYSGSGNSLIGDSETPCLCTDGANGIRFEDFAIQGPSTTASIDVVGIYIATATGAPNGQATNSTYVNMNFSNMGVGILAGGGTGAGCDDGTLINVQFQFCSLAGLRTISQNALNWSVYGGGASDCAANSTFAPDAGTPTAGNLGAAYSVPAGSIGVISSVAVSANTWDIINAGSQGMSVVGYRSESVNSIAACGSTIHVSSSSYGYGNSSGCRWFDMTFSGTIVCSGGMFNPGNNNGVGKIASLGNNGVLLMDGLIVGPGGAQCIYTGASSAKFYNRGALYNTSNPNLLSSFTGTVAQNI